MGGIVNMTLKKLLEKKEKELFYLEMKDMWNSADFAKSDELNNEIKKIKEQLKGEEDE